MSKIFDAGLREAFLAISNSLSLNSGLMENTVILCHLHCFETTSSLFRQLIGVGINAANIHVFSKPYSKNAVGEIELGKLGLTAFSGKAGRVKAGEYDAYITDQLRRFCAQVKRLTPNATRVLLLDDGGQLSTAAVRDFDTEKLKLVSVQTTTSGHQAASDLPFSVVSVAETEIKHAVEYPEIASIAFQKLEREGVLAGVEVFGVLGFGELGKAMAKCASRHGMKVVISDTKNPDPAVEYEVVTPDRLLSVCDLVAGCSGSDAGLSLIEAGLSSKFRPKSPHVSLFSMSSRDIEFGSILRKSGLELDLDEIDYPSVSLNLKWGERTMQPVKILNAGFPYNFDKERELEGSDCIFVTRALQGVGLLVGLSIIDSPPSSEILPLSKEIQDVISRVREDHFID